MIRIPFRKRSKEGIIRTYGTGGAGAVLFAAVLFTGLIAGGASAWAGGEDLFPGAEKTGSMPLSYAREYEVDYYGADYALLTIHSSFRYLIVSEGAQAPADLPEDITVLKKPLDHIYAASSSCPDAFRRLGVLDRVTMTSTKAEDWTIPKVREAVQREDMAYVGKYSSPDYEYILDEGCGLAIENTMIYHAPQVSEMLKRLGIPVMTEYSSYETEPLGRLEWIRLYGLLTDAQEEADAFFEEQVSGLEAVLEQEENGAGDRTDVAFFYIGTNGSVNVRREDDYVSRMIDMAGGRYMFHDEAKAMPASDSHSGSVTLQMERFYAVAREADVLIYNGTLGESLESLDALVAKSALLSGFRAVSSGRVYCSTDSLFQEVTATCRMIEDFYHVIHPKDGEDDETLTFLRKLE